ncbi:MAG TPA: hypothetical protein VFB58_01670 [Chloroflexota bacterium]|nr:hypothetical protein [Chloroflexota bacterium]
MNWTHLRAHLFTLAATVMGIAGMGLVFSGTMAASFSEASRGVPLLLIGLWWAGRELGRSMEASRRRKVGPGQT